jgi:lysozyme
MRALGIDISKYDLSFDPALATSQLDFVIQRVTHDLRVDAAFENLYPGVAKMPVRGAYHYFAKRFAWKEQADLFLATIKDKGFHFSVCDIESAVEEVDTAMVSGAMDWLKYVKQQTGKPVLIYSNPNHYTLFISKDIRAKDFPFWVAQYFISYTPDPQFTSPRMPTSRSDWLIWQYAPGEKNSLGNSYGVGNKGVDVNVFNGTVEELQKWAGINAPPPPPLVLPTRNECIDDMLSKNGYVWKK